MFQSGRNDCARWAYKDVANLALQAAWRARSRPGIARNAETIGHLFVGGCQGMGTNSVRSSARRSRGAVNGGDDKFGGSQSIIDVALTVAFGTVGCSIWCSNAGKLCATIL